MKFFSIFLLLTMAASAFAQNRGEGSLTLRDGRSIVRIEVGDDRDDRDMMRRIIRLERAVRDLQDKVYELQQAPAPVMQKWVCQADIFMLGQVVSVGTSEREARRNFVSECNRKSASVGRGNNFMWCKEKNAAGIDQLDCALE